MTRMLLFSLEGKQFGLELDWVRELVAFEGLTQVPVVARWFAGLAVVRGELIAAVDLAPLWSGEATDQRAVTRLVILGSIRAEFALLAEKAEELRLIDDSWL